jgi:hypothetical protein
MLPSAQNHVIVMRRAPGPNAYHKRTAAKTKISSARGPIRISNTIARRIINKAAPRLMVCAMVKPIGLEGMFLCLNRIKQPLNSHPRAASTHGSEAQRDGFLPGREEDAATNPSEVQCAEIGWAQASLVLGRHEGAEENPRHLHGKEECLSTGSWSAIREHSLNGGAGRAVCPPRDMSSAAPRTLTRSG